MRNKLGLELVRALQDVITDIVKAREAGQLTITEQISHLGTEEELELFIKSVEETKKKFSHRGEEENRDFSYLVCLLVGYKLASVRYKEAS